MFIIPKPDQNGQALLLINIESTEYSFTDTLTLLVQPTSDPLIINKPLGDIDIDTSVTSMKIYLDSLFYDADEGYIAKKVFDNSNNELVNPQIDMDTLTLIFADNVIGQSELIIAGYSGIDIATDTMTISRHKTVSINSSNLSDKFLVYPNPTAGIIFVNGDINLPFIFEIVDVYGRPVVNKSLSYDKRFDLSTFPSGIYLLKIHQADKMFIEKIIVK